MHCKAIASFVVFLSLIGFLPVSALSSTQIITKQMIEDRNNQFSAKLNARDQKELIVFLHNTLSDSLQYNISYQNQFLPEAYQQQKITLGKTDYINSFVIGTNHIDHYEAEIKTNGVKVSDNGQFAIARETIVEKGIMLYPNDLKADGIAFYNETTCENFYQINDGSLQSDKAICRSTTTHNDTI